MTEFKIETTAKTKLIYEGLCAGEVAKLLTILHNDVFRCFCEKNQYDFDGLGPFKLEAEDMGYDEDRGFNFAETYRLIFVGSGWGDYCYSIEDAGKIEINQQWYDYLKAVHQFIYETTGIGKEEP